MVQVSRTIDFTQLLGEPQNTYNFNPSIARWYGDLYLGCYRSFNRYRDVTTNRYTDDPLMDPNHPWLGGNGSATWWTLEDGHDDTGFFLFSLINNRFQIEKRFTGDSIYWVAEDGRISLSAQRHIAAVDARLLHLTGEFFLLSYNKYTRDPVQIKTTTCDRIGCFLIATRLLRLKADRLFIYPENILCPSISNPVEKNWSFWTYQEQLYFSYGLTPSHEVYRARVSFATGAVTCDPTSRREFIGYFGSLEKVYNQGLPEKSVFISVTTPALPRPGRPNRYIGVGHVKYKNDSQLVNLIQTTPLGMFYAKTQNYYRHPVYDYLMFLYEFEPVTGNLLRISDFFLPSDTDYILAFPSGLEYDSRGNLLISYGDHDSSCKLLIVREEYIDNLLKPVKISREGAIVNPLPQNLYFFFMPIECLDRGGLCYLLNY